MRRWPGDTRSTAAPRAPFYGPEHSIERIEQALSSYEAGGWESKEQQAQATVAADMQAEQAQMTVGSRRCGAEHERDFEVQVTRMPSLAATCEAAAELIAQGEVIAWYRGRMEFGPRALGHRSISPTPQSPRCAIASTPS